VSGKRVSRRRVISGEWRSYVVGVEASEKTNATTSPTEPIIPRRVPARPLTHSLREYARKHSPAPSHGDVIYSFVDCHQQLIEGIACVRAGFHFFVGYGLTI